MKKDSLVKRTFNIWCIDSRDAENKGFYPFKDRDKWKKELQSRGYIVSVNEFGDLEYATKAQTSLAL